MKNIQDIENWLNDHSINNFTVSNDFQVSVYENVNLKGKLKTKKLPIAFKLINGYFDISDNSLVSLEGCPEQITSYFNCSNNKLKGLSYAPKEVLGYFNCANNQIVSLQGTPKYIDSYFDCSSNNLETLLGGPITVKQDYLCYWNMLKDLDSLPNEIGGDFITDFRLTHLEGNFDKNKQTFEYKGLDVTSSTFKPSVLLVNKKEISQWLNEHNIKNYTILEDNSVNVDGHVHLSARLSHISRLPLCFNEVKGDFDVSDNELISLEGSPRKVGGNFLAFKNEVTSLKGTPKEVGKSFIILRNQLTSLEYSPSFIKEDYICSHNPLTSLKGVISVQGSIFTCVSISSIKSQEFVYNGVKTYKYPGIGVIDHLSKEHIALTQDDINFEKTRKNLQNVIIKMINDGSLSIEMINDTLIKNLTKYKLLNLKEKVLSLKNVPLKNIHKELSEVEIENLVFDKEI